MQEEQDTCRICSAPAEPDQPLFYPCKCSGTIRYIHQDCLTTWLAHSKKKTCDVCKYPYSFTKVYDPDMPIRLPFLLLARRFAQQTGQAVLFALRAVMVGLIWLAILPWATIWTWRMYFTMGDSTAWWISNRPRPPVSLSSAERMNITVNVNLTAPANVNGTFSPASFLAHPIVRAISADIVAGQIIATVIVIAFVTVFLLREWISQNARPGVFDDADPAPPAVEEPPPPVRAQDLRLQLENLRARAEDLNAQAEALRQQVLQNRAARVQQEAPRLLQDVQPTQATGIEPQVHGEQDTTGLRQRRPPGKELWYGTRDVDADASLAARRRRHSWNGRGSQKEDAEGLHPVASEGTSRLAQHHWSPSSEQARDIPENFPGPETPRASPHELEDESPRLDKGKARQTSNRPPLYSTAFFTPEGPSPSHLSSYGEPTGNTPLQSPSLATYHAPEELQAGPSSYFRPEGHNDNGDDNTEYDEYSLYFRQAGAGQVVLAADARDDLPSPPTPPTDVNGRPFYEDEFAPPPMGDEPPMAEIPEIEEEDNQMPPLANWTDDEFDELEEEEDVAHQPEPPVMPEPAADGNNNAFNEDRVQAAEDMQVADAMNDEDLDAGMDDDMEGALEAIGLRGPIKTVIQNAALMIFVLDTTIGVGVWLPFTIGKSIALLTLDPRRFLYILHLPIRTIRFLTDPVVDSIMFVLMRLTVPPMVRLSESLSSFAFQMLESMVGYQGAMRGVKLTTNLYHRTLEVAQDVVLQITSPKEADPESVLEQLVAQDSMFIQLATPYFAPLGKVVRIMWHDLQETWTKLAVGDGTTEKLFAIGLGYAVDVLLLALYLNVLTVGSMKNAGRAVRSAVRQQLVVVKVAAFIIVELVVFPLGCGVMLDVCTVGLFPQGSLRTRGEFLLYAPLTAAFYHWVIGTMFMYQFAVLLAGFRSCLRPGALWFIKDPQDQNFHPIRDILERSTIVHIRKLLLSAVMYGLVVACGVATVSGMLRIFSKTIMPFRWKVREPLSVVPIDLIFLHLVMPYTMQHFRPKKIVKQGGLHAWKFLAWQLRITSYMFGGRHEEEEYSLKRWTLETVLSTKHDELDKVRDGGYRRVPNSDNVALAKDEMATVEVDEEGKPLNDKEARLMRVQDDETERAKRNVKDDYTVVYIPPYFKYRVFAFIFALWMVCSIVLSGSLAIPILLGRYFFRLFTPRHVHDGYSFLAGFYLLWGCWIVSTSIDRMDKHRQRRGGDSEQRADFALYFVKRTSLWLAKVTYLAFFLGLVIPTLIATVVELYLVMPIRQTVQPELQARVRVVDMWALGLVYAKVALRAQRLRPLGRISRAIDQIRRQGWTHPHPWMATKEVIAPVVFGLLGMIVFPPSVLWVAQRVVQIRPDRNLLLLHIYPSIFTFAACIQTCIALSTVIKTWSQAVRDSEFLVEMRLQNLEQEAKLRESERLEGEDATLVEEEED